VIVTLHWWHWLFVVAALTVILMWNSPRGNAAFVWMWGGIAVIAAICFGHFAT